MKKTEAKEEQKIILTVKQREVLLKTIQERTLLETQVQQAQAKESEITNLILDAHGIDTEKAQSIKLDDTQAVLEIIMK